MAFSVFPVAEEQLLLRAPKRRTIPLPVVPAPFTINPFLANPNGALARIEFSLHILQQALSLLTVEQANQPATTPATTALRIVHPRLNVPLYIHPTLGSGHEYVTVADVLTGIHRGLWAHLSTLDTLDLFRRREVILSTEERCRRSGLASDAVRYIDLLDGATFFMGLTQDVSKARQYVAQGHHGIDGYQAVTWILQTEEPCMPMGLGRYPRHNA